MRTLSTVLAAAVSCALTAFAFVGSAAAQGAPPPVAQPTAPSTADPHQLPPVAEGATPAPLPPAAQPGSDDEDDKDEEGNPKKKHSHRYHDIDDDTDHVRFRGGVSGYGGAYIVGGFGIPYGGVEGRLGVQIKDWVAVYAEPAFLFGATVGDNGGGVVARASLGFIPEFTIADLWFIGLGPELYATGVISSHCPTNATSCNTLALASASIIGINGRTGFAFGSVHPGRRKMFTVAFDGRLDFFGGHPGFAPGLSLGYDAM